MADNIFTVMSAMTDKKIPWNKLSDELKKEMNPYMVNRFLSMNMELIELVDLLQKYTIGILTPELVYRIYFDILPHAKFFSKYIKAKKEADYPNQIVELMATHLKCSTREINLMLDDLDSKEVPQIFNDLLVMYGHSEKDIKKILNVKTK